MFPTLPLRIIYTQRNQKHKRKNKCQRAFACRLNLGRGQYSTPIQENEQKERKKEKGVKYAGWCGDGGV
jgi:hypothetical protein